MVRSSRILGLAGVTGALLLATACLGGNKGEDEVSSERDFLEAFTEKFCAEWEACNPDFACSGGSDTTTVVERCEFDLDAGRDCLDGEWICNDSNTAFPIVEMPMACNQVFDCTSSTTSSYTY